MKAFENAEPEYRHLIFKALKVLDKCRVDEPEKLEAALAAVDGEPREG